MKIEFTDQDVAVLRSMLDVALKAVGRQAAKSFIILDDKLEAAQRAAAMPQQEEVVEMPPPPELQPVANGNAAVNTG